tara:strand:+ start:2252 stop:2884 length:633 start_codon:yes stop_codon:yes gene_type:complete
MPVLTSRIETVFKRFVCSKLHQMEEFIKSLNTGDRPSEFDELFDDINENGSIKFPIRFKEFELTIDIYYRGDDDESKNYYLDIDFGLIRHDSIFSSISKKKIDDIYLIMNEFDTWIHQYLDKNIEPCKHCRSNYVKMNKVVEQEDFNCCYDCFPYIQEMGENCCICLDDEPTVWIQFKPCGHKTHKICYDDMKGIKCPLCRAEVKDWDEL